MTANPAPAQATAKPAATTTPKKAPAARKASAAAPKAATAKAPSKPAPQPAVQPGVKPGIAPKTASTKPVVAKTEKPKKIKLVRDSLSIPKNEYEIIAVLKLRAGKLGHAAKKTEIIRAGIKAVAAMSDQALLKALQAVPSIKTGRPAKNKGK